MKSISWNNALSCLELWYQDSNNIDEEELFTFLRQEAYRMYPIAEEEQKKQDIIQRALLRILDKDKPLSEILNLRRYLWGMLRKLSLGEIRKRKKRNKRLNEVAEFVDNDPREDLSPEKLVEQQEKIQKMNELIKKLKIEDAVIIKLDAAPSILNSEEIDWLVKHSALARKQVEQILANGEKELLIGLFYPEFRGKESSDERRKFFEKFRVRRNRALKKTRVLMGEE